MGYKIEPKIISIKGQRVLLDSDSPQLYGVSTIRLNEQVTRSLCRFPSGFVFLLSFQEFKNLMSHNAISGSLHGGRGKHLDSSPNRFKGFKGDATLFRGSKGTLPFSAERKANRETSGKDGKDGTLPFLNIYHQAREKGNVPFFHFSSKAYT